MFTKLSFKLLAIGLCVAYVCIGGSVSKPLPNEEKSGKSQINDVMPRRPRSTGHHHHLTEEQVEFIVRVVTANETLKLQRQIDNLRNDLFSEMARIAEGEREVIISRLAECVPPCVHGRCTGTNQCTCNRGWRGSLCRQAVCSPPCQNGGYCVSPGVCSCTDWYDGNRCQTRFTLPEDYVRDPEFNFNFG